MSDSLTITIITLSSLQCIIYLILLIICLYKLSLSCKTGNNFMQLLYIFTFIYILLQLTIQAYQLITIILDNQPQDNVNMVLALNIICMVIDVYVLVLLTFYWEQVQGSFVDNVGDGVGKGGCFRFGPAILWGLCYLGYFGYLLGTGTLTQTLQTVSHTNKIFLYIVSQSLSAIMLILYSIWQSYHWCKLQDTIESFQRIIPVTMNKTRFKAIFWITTGFNSIRSIFIAYLIVQAIRQNYFNLIIALNCFTLTATVAIGFYLFGFKIQENRETKVDLFRRDTDSSKKASSSHQTELSRHSNRDKQQQIKP